MDFMGRQRFKTQLISPLAFDVENGTNGQVTELLMQYLNVDETDKFNRLLERVSDFINSQTKTGLFGKSKNKNNSNNNKNPLNLKSIFLKKLHVVDRSKFKFQRLLLFAISKGNIDAVKTLINVYNDDVNVAEQNSPLAAAIHCKPEIVGKRGKKEFFNLLTFLLAKGCKLSFDFQNERDLKHEDIVLDLLYQTNSNINMNKNDNNMNGINNNNNNYNYNNGFNNNSNNNGNNNNNNIGNGNSGDSKENENEQYEEMNNDLVDFLSKAHSKKEYKFSYDWKKWDKKHFKAFHCVSSGNLQLFEYLLKKSAFGMKKLNWNKGTDDDKEYTLFHYIVLQIENEKWEANVAVQFWDLMFNNVFDGKKGTKKDILNTRKSDGNKTAIHLILENGSKCPQLVDRAMKLGLNPNDDEYRCYIIRYIAPCVEAMKIVMNENKAYKHTFDLDKYVNLQWKDYHDDNKQIHHPTTMHNGATWLHFCCTKIDALKYILSKLSPKARAKINNLLFTTNNHKDNVYGTNDFRRNHGYNALMYTVHPNKLFYSQEMKGNLELARFFIKTFYPKGCDLDINKYYESGFSVDPVNGPGTYFTILEYALLCDPEHKSMATALIEEYGTELDIRAVIYSRVRNGDYPTMIWLMARPEITPNLSKLDLLRNKGGQVVYSTQIELNNIKLQRDDNRINLKCYPGKANAFDFIMDTGNASTFANIILEVIKVCEIRNWKQWNECFGVYFDSECFSRWKFFCQRNGFQVLNTFLSDLHIKAIKNGNFGTFKMMLNNGLKKTEEVNEEVDRLTATLRKDTTIAKFLFDKCKKETLEDLNNVINESLSNQSCGFNDSLLILSNMIDNKRLIKNLQNITNECLGYEKKNVQKHTFFKNNLLTSNIWSVVADESKQEKETKTNEAASAPVTTQPPIKPQASASEQTLHNIWTRVSQTHINLDKLHEIKQDEVQKVQKEQKQDETKDESKDEKKKDDEHENEVITRRGAVYGNMSAIEYQLTGLSRGHTGGGNKSVNDMLEESAPLPGVIFDEIQSSVVFDELKRQQMFIQNALINEEKNNGLIWKELKEIESKWWDERDFVQFTGPYGQGPQRIIKAKCHSIAPKYHKDELPFDNVNGFDGPKEFDHNLYLTELLIESHIINNAFQEGYENYFSIERFRIPCKFTPAPVKTKERAIVKAELDYKLREWPHTRHVLDLLRCSVVFDTIDDLVKGVKKFIAENEKNPFHQNVASPIVRLKNGFSDIGDKCWELPLSSINYCDIKINMRFGQLIGEIQFIPKFMLDAKRMGHGIYSFVRKQNLFHSICKQYQLSNNNEKFAEEQLSSMILTQNLSDLSKHLESATQFEKEYIVKNEMKIKTLMKETNWIKGINLVQLCAKQWRQESGNH